MRTVERAAVRVVVLDAAGAVLLLHTRDPTQPRAGTWWELPGGGLEPGETYREAAVRELAEETGLRVAPDRVGPPAWRRRAAYRYRGELRISNEVVVAVRLAVDRPAVDGSGRVGFEAEDFTGHRWWPVAELAATGPRCYPGRLPALIRPFLAGEEIDEPFEDFC